MLRAKWNSWLGIAACALVFVSCTERESGHILESDILSLTIQSQADCPVVGAGRGECDMVRIAIHDMMHKSMNDDCRMAAGALENAMNAGKMRVDHSVPTAEVNLATGVITLGANSFANMWNMAANLAHEQRHLDLGRDHEIPFEQRGYYDEIDYFGFHCADSIYPR
jgi:hypothetical protein